MSDLISNNDFPPTPNAEIDSKKYFDAYMTARDRLTKKTEVFKGIDLAACILELTGHIYCNNDHHAALFRRRNDASDVVCDLWLSKLRTISKWFIHANGLPEFNGISKDELFQLPRNFITSESIRNLPEYLSKLGIVLIFQPALQGMKMDGAIFKAPSRQVVIGLSLRYPRLDHFWFTLMHELAHAHLHLDFLDTPIIDDLDQKADSEIEESANRLASNSLISSSVWRANPVKFNPKENVVRDFARAIGVAPQIVAGRYQRDVNRYDIFSDIVNEFNTREILNKL